jgi:hypothetical protein
MAPVVVTKGTIYGSPICEVELCGGGPSPFPTYVTYYESISHRLSGFGTYMVQAEGTFYVSWATSLILTFLVPSILFAFIGVEIAASRRDIRLHQGQSEQSRT